MIDDDWEKSEVIVKDSGTVRWGVMSRFLTSCNVDVYYLPFDQQDCHIYVTNWFSSARDTNFTSAAETVKTANMTQSKEWDVISSSVVAFESTKPHLSTVRFTLSLRRKSGYYLYTMILPVILLSFIGLMVFLLPPESGEKISLSVACMMAFFITQLSISEHMPTGWEAMPIISK